VAFLPPGAFGTVGPTVAATVAGNSNTVVLVGLVEPTGPDDVDVELGVQAASAVAVSADGSGLAVGGDRLEVWSTIDDLGTTDGRSVDAPAPVTVVAFAPDSTTVAAGLASGAVLLVRVAAGEAPQQLGLPLPATGGAVRSVTFAPDGRTLAVADASGSVALWDVAEPDRPHLLGPVLTGGGPARFRPDGTLMVGRADGRLEAWDLGFAEAARADPAGRACAIVRDGLSRDDWHRAITLPFRETC
jgi:WD40 repeat protein